ncbi:protein ANTAGONIST OF LIKE HETEROCHROMATIN PROTEIN 1-like [Phragmites australis]|uniref:protein ANTAGONIST OF LIKE HETEROCHROMATIN PROTEIN 1-like n=1 Tax=Phragmites australis TaxID=29695 RepID=UPI002D78C3EB|nr:protein ANTAGONIST OF LIKE HETEROCHROMATIN PROTEIN 1-like [Phragmites australis]
MVASGRKRSRRAPIPAPSSPPPAPAPAQSPPQLTSLLALLASSVTLALRFAADRDLLLLPSQTLALDPLLLSAARAVSRLLALLPLHLQTLTLTSLSLSPPTPSPSLPSSWFLRLLSSPSLPDSAWRDAFRMSKPAFFQLLHALALPTPTASSSSSTLALPPDHKLGAALFRLAHAAPARAVARRFGLPSPSVAARAFYEVCRAIADRLAVMLDLAAPDRIARAVPGFCALSLPNCCGALGYARFGDAAIAQALVDADGRFLDVSVGWDLAMAPAEILPRTKLYTSQSIVLANAPQGELIGGSVPRYFLGPACCPLLPWLVTPYKDMGATDDLSKESVFNYVHAHGMQVVKNAFGHVRARWRLLEECWKGECQEALPYVVVAGCLLHNFLIKCGEPLPEEIQGDANADVFVDFEGEKDKEGERIKDVLAAHLSLDDFIAINLGTLPGSYLTCPFFKPNEDAI